MEMDLSLIYIFFSFIFSIIFSLYYLPSLLRSQKNENRSLKIPPGSTGLPLIGETREFLSAGRKGIPEKFIFDRLKNYSSNVITTSLFGETMALFCGPEANKFIFSNENKLVKSWVPRSMRLLFGGAASDVGMAYRTLFAPYVSPDALQRYVSILDLGSKQHMKNHWEGRDIVKVHQLAKLYTLTMASRLFLGIEDEETVASIHKPFEQLMQGLLCIPVNIPGTTFHSALKAKAQLQKDLDARIKKWKSDYSEGRLSDSQSIVADILIKTFEEEDIVTKILVVFGAAYGTTSKTLACIVMFLGQFPDVYNKVLAEQRGIAESKAPGETLTWADIQKMKYSWHVACETLRVHPPFGSFKEAISDFTYGDFLIPKGWKLYYSILGTHKNPSYFKDPEKFDPSRFEGDGPLPYTFIPFGGGPRMCPGKEYARVKILVFMHNLVTKFTWEQIFPDEMIISDPVTRPTKGLPIRLYPRTS